VTEKLKSVARWVASNLLNLVQLFYENLTSFKIKKKIMSFASKEINNIVHQKREGNETQATQQHTE
jgi:hypothetical protein